MTGDRSPLLPARKAHQENQLLATLLPDDLDRMIEQATIVPLERGRILQRMGEPVREALFPHSGEIVLQENIGEHCVAEVGTIGAEGFCGFWAILGRDTMALNQAVVRTSGTATRVSADALQNLMQFSPIHDLLLRYTKLLLKQTFQMIACNNNHPLAARCARSLLEAQDRRGGNVFKLTQEELAAMLGVRRQSLSGHWSNLERCGVFRVGRGRVEIMDRSALEAVACGCYQAIRSAAKLVDARFGSMRRHSP